MSDTTLMVCALNLNADPHPEGVYVAALKEAAKLSIQARGADYAKITAPTKIRNENAYSGRILVWTEIDEDGRWLNIDDEDELSDEKKKDIVIPGNSKPNYRTFYYVFSDKNHRLYFESKNEFNEILGPRTAKRIFSYLLAQPSVMKIANISVSILPDHRALENILSLPRIKKIQIRINTPNADHPDPEKKRRVMERLNRIGASRLEETYSTRKIKTDIKPDSEITEAAEIAAETGFVRVDSYDNEGRRITTGTDDFPRRFFVGLTAGETLFQRMKSRFGGLF